MALVISQKTLQMYSHELAGRALCRYSQRAQSNRVAISSQHTLKSGSDSTTSLMKENLLSTTAAPNQERNAVRFTANPIIWYSKKLETHPLITKCMTSAFIAGSDDLVCQYVIYKQKSKNGMDNYAESNGIFDPDLQRTSRFTFLGMTSVAPMCHTWFGIFTP